MVVNGTILVSAIGVIMKSLIIILTLIFSSAFAYISIDQSNEYLNLESARDKTETYEGVLEPAYAIGGETTGVVIRTEQGDMIELKGKDNEIHERLKTLAFNRSFAKVTGYFITVRGVEIPERKVFKVLEVSTED